MSLNERSVLVAEDEVLIALNLSRILTRAGARVVAVGYVADGLALDLEGIDLALLDVSLTDGEVFPLARRLRDLGIPIIFHSGYICRRSSFSEFPQAILLEKPAHRGEILAALGKALGDETLCLGAA